MLKAIAELPACHLHTKSWYRNTPTLLLVFFLIEVLASIVIIFDKVSEGRSERNDGNPARIIPAISSFIPGIEESRVLVQMIGELALRTEATTERTKNSNRGQNAD
jgi:hypothetical protein